MYVSKMGFASLAASRLAVAETSNVSPTPPSRRSIIRNLIRLSLCAAFQVATRLNRHGASPLHLAIVKGLSDVWLGRLLWAHRAAASIQDGEWFLTPLHVALRYRRTSLVAVSLLVDAHTACLAAPSRMGYLPMHVAAQFCSSVDIICYLALMHPPAILARTLRGKETPLHLACSVDNPSSDKIVLALLDCDPDLVTSRNAFGQTPFSIVYGMWDAFEASPNGRIKIEATNSLADVSDGLLGRLWNKLRYLAKARHFNQYNVRHSHTSLVSYNSLLHASIGTSCPPSFIFLVLRLFPDQASTNDMSDRLPLAIAASVQFRCCLEGGQVIEKLLSEYPRAASIPDAGGSYPLHLAIENCIPWTMGLHSVFHAYPEAIDIDHGPSGLAPFMLAATPKRKQRREGKSENFELSKTRIDLHRSKVLPRNDSFDEYEAMPYRFLSLSPWFKSWEEDVSLMIGGVGDEVLEENSARDNTISLIEREQTQLETISQLIQLNPTRVLPA